MRSIYAPAAERRMIMRPIDADRALEIVRDQAIAHPNAYHLTNYATLILQEAPTLTDLSKCLAFNSTADGKPQTNADKIRAMSDEELAKFLHEPFCDKRTHEECTISYCGVCDQCVLDWLQQPAEEVDHEDRIG